MAEKSPENVALVDMDGTVCRYREALDRDTAAVLEGETVSPGTLDRIQALIKAQPGWWRNLEPYGLGITIVETLAQIGFRIMVLTKGPQRAKNAWSEKFEWCAKHIPSASVTVTQDKGLVYGKVLVDDWPEYVDRWLQWRPRGLVLMPAQEWNADCRRENVHRIGSVEQLYAMKPLLVETLKRRGTDA